MLVEETVRFFKKIPPFTFLSEGELAGIAGDIYLKYYPHGVKILAQSGPPSDYLYVIKKGAVKVYITSDEGEEMVIDYRGEGESFGFISMVGEDRSRATVAAVEDTLCYLIPRERMLALLKTNPQVNEYFMKSFFINFIDRTYEETRKRYSMIGESDRVLYTTPVRDIISRRPVTAADDTPLQQAAGIMAREKVSSLIIVDGSGVPVGIVTDRDLREKVVARGRNFNEPVRNIMSAPLIRVDAGEYCFEALVRMMRYNIHHILVIENGELSGVVTNHDFMVLQGSSPTSLVRSIEKQGSFESIAEAFGKVFKTVSTLLREGARAEHITGLITEVTEKLIDRTIELIEVKIGPAPLPYSMFIYGDGGRRELTLNPVLRLGIAYTDTEDPEALSRTSNYFNEFREIFLEALGVCGLKGKEILPGEYIKGYAEWKGMFEKWSSEPFRHEPDEGLFEMRAVRGEEEQITALRGHLASLAGEHEDFMDYMATKAVENRPPLGFFGKLIVEKTGEHRNELNLYSKGLKPIADSIRIFSLEKGVRELATHKRILALGERYEFEADRDVEQAMEYLLTLLLHHQLVQMEKSEATDDFLNPEALANLEKKTLKESFQLIANLYDIIEKGYRTERSPS